MKETQHGGARLESEDSARGGALSRRRLLAAGASAMAMTFPVFGDDTSAGRGPVSTDRQHRLAAILDRHGPEIGGGR